MNNPNRAPRLVVSIDSLALNGFAHFDGDRFGSALQRELGALLAAGVPTAGAWHVESVKLDMPGAGAPYAPIDSAGIGIQVARAIYAQMQFGQMQSSQVQGDKS